MGFFKKLFGLEKKNEASSKLNSMMEQMNSQVFPGGSAQKSRELNELARELGLPAEQITGTFVYACVRAYLGGDRETLIFGIKNHNPELSDIQLNTFAKYVTKKAMRQKMGIDNEDFLEEYLKGIGFVNAVGSYDEIPGCIGEFGLDASNPVPVNGVPANERYLGRLSTLTGEKITWNRLGSCQVDGIDNPVDIYNIKDSLGRELPTIYISSYHPKTSDKAPRGYRID